MVVEPNNEQKNILQIGPQLYGTGVYLSTIISVCDEAISKDSDFSELLQQIKQFFDDVNPRGERSEITNLRIALMKPGGVLSASDDKFFEFLWVTGCFQRYVFWDKLVQRNQDAITSRVNLRILTLFLNASDGKNKIRNSSGNEVRTDPNIFSRLIRHNITNEVAFFNELYKAVKDPANDLKLFEKSFKHLIRFLILNRRHIFIDNNQNFKYAFLFELVKAVYQKAGNSGSDLDIKVCDMIFHELLDNEEVAKEYHLTADSMRQQALSYVIADPKMTQHWLSKNFPVVEGELAESDALLDCILLEVEKNPELIRQTMTNKLACCLLQFRQYPAKLSKFLNRLYSLTNRQVYSDFICAEIVEFLISDGSARQIDQQKTDGRLAIDVVIDLLIMCDHKFVLVNIAYKFIEIYRALYDAENSHYKKSRYCHEKLDGNNDAIKFFKNSIRGVVFEKTTRSARGLPILKRYFRGELKIDAPKVPRKIVEDVRLRNTNVSGVGAASAGAASQLSAKQVNPFVSDEISNFVKVFDVFLGLWHGYKPQSEKAISEFLMSYGVSIQLYDFENATLCPIVFAIVARPGGYLFFDETFQHIFVSKNIEKLSDHGFYDALFYATTQVALMLSSKLNYQSHEEVVLKTLIYLVNKSAWVEKRYKPFDLVAELYNRLDNEYSEAENEIAIQDRFGFYFEKMLFEVLDNFSMDYATPIDTLIEKAWYPQFVMWVRGVSLGNIVYKDERSTYKIQEISGEMLLHVDPAIVKDKLAGDFLQCSMAWLEVKSLPYFLKNFLSSDDKRFLCLEILNLVESVQETGLLHGQYVIGEYHQKAIESLIFLFENQPHFMTLVQHIMQSFLKILRTLYEIEKKPSELYEHENVTITDKESVLAFFKNQFVSAGRSRGTRDARAFGLLKRRFSGKCSQGDEFVRAVLAESNNRNNVNADMVFGILYPEVSLKMFYNNPVFAANQKSLREFCNNPVFDEDQEDNDQSIKIKQKYFGARASR